MFRKILLLFLILGTAAIVVGCLSATPDEVAEKIAADSSLNSSDYDVMLDYLQTATDAMIPRLKATRSVGDMEFVEADIQKQYPLVDAFNTALLRDFPNLSAEQTQRMASMRTQAQEAVSGKKF